MVSFHGLMLATLMLFMPSMLSGVQFKFSPVVLVEPRAFGEQLPLLPCLSRLLPSPGALLVRHSAERCWGRRARPFQYEGQEPALSLQDAGLLVLIRFHQEFTVMWLMGKKTNTFPPNPLSLCLALHCRSKKLPFSWLHFVH